MEMERVLIHLGLNEKQAKVYLALLQLGSGSVPTISVRSEVKRPTAYLILEELRQKELAVLVPKSTKIYSSKSPQILLEEQSQKESEIRSKMPELLAIYNSKKEKPKITFYEGEENMVRLYKDIFGHENVDIFGSIKTITKSEAVQKNLRMLLKMIKDKKTKVRELLEAGESSEKYMKNAKDYGAPGHEIKIAPEEYAFPTDNIIYGNKLAIFSYKDIPQAVVIESSDVATTYRSVFEILWANVAQ